MTLHRAVEIFVEDLRLPEKERRLVAAIIKSSHVAARGEETLVPIIDAIQALGVRGPNQVLLAALKEYLGKVAHIRKQIQLVDGVVVTFSVFQSVSVRNDSKFIVFTLSREASAILNSIQKQLNSERGNME
ncbi:hypothetical protein [Pseudoduganella sp. R-34]|uniref:hypothetical protein n=1 Tax=Pseudoduganella sp. R-34 TaxID=3404062 RepID=UPI003CF435D2